MSSSCLEDSLARRTSDIDTRTPLLDWILVARACWPSVPLISSSPSLLPLLLHLLPSDSASNAGCWDRGTSHLLSSLRIAWMAKHVRSCARAVDLSSGTKWCSRILMPISPTVSSQGGALPGFRAPLLLLLLLPFFLAANSLSSSISEVNFGCLGSFEAGNVMVTLAGSIAPSSPIN